VFENIRPGSLQDTWRRPVHIIIRTTGAGVPKYHDIITLQHWPDFYKEPDERERIRMIFYQAFSDLLRATDSGETISVTFADEDALDS